MIEATCHCGNVSIRVDDLPEYFVSCNCSICRRLGALWAYYAAGDVAVQFGAEPTATYVRGDGMIAFHHCPRCGCTTHYASTDKSEHERVGLNCRMVAPEKIESIRVRRFDGADTWKFLDESNA